MGIFNTIKRAFTPLDDFYQEGYEDGQAYSDANPGLQGRDLAHVQVQVSAINDGLGYSFNQGEQYDNGFWEGYTGKVYCEECQGYYLPHEH